MPETYLDQITAELERLGLLASADNPSGFVVRETTEPGEVVIGTDSGAWTYGATMALEILGRIANPTPVNVHRALWPALLTRTVDWTQLATLGQSAFHGRAALREMDDLKRRGK